MSTDTRPVAPPVGPPLVPEPDEVDGSYLITSIDSPWVER